MKHLHLLFVVAVIGGFVWRVYLAEKNPAKLAEKWLKILPHALAAGLLATGIGLVMQGNWAGNYGWIVAKLCLMIVFIIAGLLTLKEQGQKRWIAFGVALFSFAFILKLAATKQLFFF